jgi:hypothetical protein
MAVTYTSNLKLGLPTTGTESGTWGDVVNDQITSLVDQSVSGTVSLTSMTNANYTLTNGNGNAANEARYMALLVPSSLTLTAARNIIVPSTSKMYIVKNATTGGFSVTVKTSAGTGIEVPNGATMLLYCDGTNVIVAFDTITTTTQNSGQLAGLRNRIVNGGMSIDQRNSGVAQTITAGAALAYTVDRFYAYSTGANVTGQQVAGTSPNAYLYRFTGAASVTKIGFAQRIENINCQDLAGKTATLSVDLSNSLLTTVTWTAYYANSANTFGSLASPTRTLISTGTFTVTATLTRYNTNITVPSAATTGIEIELSVAAQTSGTWNIGNFQLELGSVATTFEQRFIGLEYLLGQRYYQAAYVGWEGQGGAGSSAGTGYTFSPPMFVTPTVANISDDRNVNTTAGVPSSYNLRAYGATFYKAATISGNTGWANTISLTAEL